MSRGRRLRLVLCPACLLGETIGAKVTVTQDSWLETPNTLHTERPDVISGKSERNQETYGWFKQNKLTEPNPCVTDRIHKNNNTMHRPPPAWPLMVTNTVWAHRTGMFTTYKDKLQLNSACVDFAITPVSNKVNISRVIRQCKWVFHTNTLECLWGEHIAVAHYIIL